MPNAADQPKDPVREKIEKLLARARSGDLRVVPRLRWMLDHNPEFCRRHGDLARHAELAWCMLVGGNDLLLTETLARQVATMKKEIAGPNPSPLEELLVARIAAGWLQVGYADALVAQSGEQPLKVAEFAQKRQTMAQARYVAAIKALAELRRLLPPALSAAGSAAVKQPRHGGGVDQATAPSWTCSEADQTLEQAPLFAGQNRIERFLQPVGATAD